MSVLHDMAQHLFNRDATGGPEITSKTKNIAEKLDGE
jgi:hypothetical protein